MTRATKKPEPSTYAPVTTATEFADNVTTDPLFCTTRVGSNRRPCWVPVDRIGEYKGMAHSPYQYVDPKDVEELDGGRTRPTEKDFGVFVKVVDGQDRVTLGSPPHVLMWCYTAAHEERQRRLQAASAALKPPTRGRPGEERETTNEQIMSLEDLKGRG